MIVTCSEMKALEAKAFADGVSAEALMEQAGAEAARAVEQFFPKPGVCVAVFGKGHNGGDALVAARHLSTKGWETHLAPAFPDPSCSNLTRKKFDEAGLCHHHPPGALPSAERLRPELGRPLVVLDGLLGVGATGALREPIAGMCAAVNALRESANAQVFALDIPTGLDGDTGAADPACIVADFTLAVGFAKRGLVADDAANHVGRLVVLPLKELEARKQPFPTASTVATPFELARLLPRRRFESHKGDFGRIGIVAGSRGLTGAAIMAATACVRAGAGLVSLYVTEDIHPIVAAVTPPEVMVKPVRSYLEVLETKRDVLAIGPGLGQHRRDEVLALIRRCEQPMVIDADGLNILSTQLDVLDRSAGPRLLTPHPGEMARLDPGSSQRSREQTVRRFTEAHPAALLLKGSRTLVGERNLPLSYNSTGNPGMASGGMGDALTGVCAGLAGHGLDLYDAARLGAWLCGRAAELAVSHGGESQESLSATRLIAHLGAAFNELRSRGF